jgi:hypothetical protein
VFGPTGSGKSTQLLNLAVQNAALPSRPGMLVIDLKDSLVAETAVRLPPHRQYDVLLFDPADRAFPPAFNPLANVPEALRTLAAGELVSVFERVWGASSWGPRVEHVLRHATLTLLETPQATLLDLRRLLTNPDYRQYALSHTTNFSVRAFWEDEFPSIVGTRGSLANVESLLNKLSLLSYPEIRNVLGQTRRGLDIAAAMQEGRIVLAHLPQGVMGEDASSFIAALLVAHVQLAAQRRVTMPEQARKRFLLFADECQNYDITSFDKLITEGRSMGVGVIAACQFEEQLPISLRQTMQHNCALKLRCRTEGRTHLVDVVHLQQDPKGEFPRILTAKPSKATPNVEQLRFLRERSRRTLGQPRAAVERDIQRRLHAHAGHTTNGDTTGREDPPRRNGATRDNPSGQQHQRSSSRARFYEN